MATARRPRAAGPDGGAADRVAAEELVAVETACRVLVAVSARAIGAVADVVDLGQYRVLAVVRARGAVSLGELAQATGMTLSTASRSAERLVQSDLVRREADPHDRRHLVLTLSPRGRATVSRVVARRRAELEPALARMPARRRAALAALLEEFARTAGEPSADELWSMGWTG